MDSDTQEQKSYGIFEAQQNKNCSDFFLSNTYVKIEHIDWRWIKEDDPLYAFGARGSSQTSFVSWNKKKNPNYRKVETMDETTA